MIDGIKPAQLAKLKKLIEAGEAWRFYSWRAWRDPAEGIRARVLKMDHYQCYFCHRPLNNGRMAIVHHVNHLEEAPDLALSIYTPSGSRQLVTCCKACHELQHPEALQGSTGEPAEPVTAERWD